MYTFSDAKSFWAYVQVQARDQQDVKSVRDAMNHAKDARSRAQFQRVEDQFARAKRALEEETQKGEKALAQIASVWIYYVSYIQIPDTLIATRSPSATRPHRKSKGSRCCWPV